jgi:hypothetical protein
VELFSPAQDRAQVQQLVRLGEHLLWIGRSDPAVRFTPGDGFLIPFSIVWCAFAVFVDVEAISSGGPLFFDAWGLLFVCFGLYFVAGRFVVKAKKKRRTVYALTDRRAIVSVGSRVTDQLLPDSGSSVTRQRHRDHLTVTFGSGTSSLRGFNNSGFNRYGNTGLEGLFGFPAPVAFYDVAEVDALEAALDQVSWGGPSSS